MSENGEIYTASKNFTLPPALTALTNFNSVLWKLTVYCCLHIFSVVTLAFDHCLEKNKKELSTPPKKRDRASRH